MFKVGDRVRIKNDKKFYNANKEGYIDSFNGSKIRVIIDSAPWTYYLEDLMNLTNLEIFNNLGTEEDNG